MCVIALPYGALKLAGFKLRNSKPDASQAGNEADLGSGQFSLRQLMLFSLGASLLAAVASAAHLRSQEWADFAIGVIPISLITLAITCSVLIPRNRRMAGILAVVFCAIAIVLLVGAVIILSRGFIGLADSFLIIAFLVTHFVLFVGCLSIYRALHYRLARGGKRSSAAGAAKN